MISNNVKKIEAKYCTYCGANFPEGSLNDYIEGIKIIVCESCGTENKIENLEIQDDKKKERTNVKKGKSDKNRKDSFSKKEFNRLIRLYIFRTIYEMLKDTEYNYDIKEEQDELTEIQLNHLANALRKKVLEQEIQEEWLNNLNVIKRLDFKEYYDILQLILSSKRQFKAEFLRYFQKAIEFVFELIKGKLMISELETDKSQEYKFIKNKKEIAEDLIKKFGFLEDMKQRGNFETFLAVFISRYIYDTIKDPKFGSVMGEYKGDLTAYQVDKLALSLERVFSCQQINDEWFENFNRFKKRSFLKNYKRLQNYILTDHLYSVSFLDYLKYLIRLVDGLINGKNNDSGLKGKELIIARDLRRGDPFQSIGASNPLFKPNLLIVLGRIAYLIAKTMESTRKSNEDQASRLEKDTDKILNQIMPEIATRNKINDELLKKLYKISKEEFQNDYDKLKSNIKSDQICYAQVSFYLKWVIETILNILSGAKSVSKLSIIEKVIVRDLKNFQFNDSKFKSKELNQNISIEKANLINYDKDNKINIKKCFTKYTTLQLVEDLICEMQKLANVFSIELALKFPERLTRNNYKFGIKKLADYWNSPKTTVEKRMANIRQGFNFLRDKRNFVSLKMLEENISKKFGNDRASKCISLINEYKSLKITGIEFVDQLLLELGRISGEIELSIEEINIILFSEINTISNLRQRITSPNHRDYNPDYKLSLETLDRMIENLKKLFREQAKSCICLIEKYKDINLDLKIYSKQQHHVGDPHFFADLMNFKNIKNLNTHIIKAYWFGFLSADGWLTEPKHYTIGIELSSKDKEILIKLAKDIRLNTYKVKIRDFLRLKGTEMKPYSILKFRCRPMFEDLKKLNFRSSKILSKNVPQFVKNIVSKAKLDTINSGIDWKQVPFAKTALAWLLGYYDGDGHYIGHRSGCIYSASKIFLIDIKRIFNIKNKILIHGKSGIKCEIYGHTYISKGTYRLNLGPYLLEAMWDSYKDSMPRKRP